MHLVALDACTQRGVHHLVTLDRALALERIRNDNSLPMAAVAIEFAMATRQAFGDDGFEFSSSHSGFLSAADLVTDTQQMNGRRTGDDQG